MSLEESQLLLEVTPSTSPDDIAKVFQENRGKLVRVRHATEVIVLGVIDPDIDYLTVSQFTLLEATGIFREKPADFVDKYTTVEAIYLQAYKGALQD
ncbi:MAG: hypothetical protein H6502_00595 [Candidatus Woesearchaeota archaeon]|nr:MAG: hypothetical protein H6502_00595 [Candidatus Woesearchaeota archaeon]